ncbi:MAG: cytochrome c3 family protein [Deltaproteobacteria bacterium]|jgi:hypothetical protein|nr:cytochrome c3 family protein [Deltaproteobacteria bacterium]
MNKLFFLAISAAFLVGLIAGSPLWAKGQADVTNGVHNLSATGVDPWYGTPGSSIYATDEQQVCIFCHTPHGGSLTGPLWNRNNPSSTWSHYNSATLSSYLQGLSTSRPINDESLLCMSCHDGSISVNHIINEPNDRATAIVTSFTGDPDTEIIDFFGVTAGARIGGSSANTGGTGDLSDDHPISFSYTQVLNSPEYQPSGAKYGDLKLQSLAEGAGVRFFGADSNVECSSCHDPHVDYLSNPDYAPFLVTPNTGSNLCFACHDK